MISFSDFCVEVHDIKLKNNLPVTLFYRKGMPISIKLAFISGSRFDPLGKEGVAHFLEHMILAGSKLFPTKDKVAVFIESIGGAFGGLTSTDLLMIDLELATAKDFPQAVMLLNEIINNARFTPETIDTERGSIRVELGKKRSNPNAFKMELYRDLFYQGTEKGRSTLGSEDSITNITKKDLVDFYTTMLTNERGVLLVSGDITSSELTAQLNDGLVLRKSNEYKLPPDLPVIRNQSISIQRFTDTNQTHLVLGFRTIPFAHEDLVPLILLAEIFGGGRGSVLAQKLRYEKGLVYSIGCFSYNSIDSGAWAVTTSAETVHVQKVIDIISQEFSRIFNGGVTAEELEFSINKEIKSTQRRIQTSEALVNQHLLSELVYKKKRLPDYLNSVAAVGLDDLARVGKTYFKPGSWYLAACGNLFEDDVTVNY